MTVMTNLIIFVIFGIGLDDTFIITGGFARTRPEDDIEDRIRHIPRANDLRRCRAHDQHGRARVGVPVV